MKLLNGHFMHIKLSQSACDAYDGCHYYTYFPSDSHCILFVDCPSLDTGACNDCVSGQPGCDLGGGDDTGN